MRLPDGRIIPLDQVHYDPETGLHMVTDCATVHGHDKPAQPPIERTDPAWYPIALRRLAANHPSVSDALWATAIQDGTGHMGVLLHLALDYPKTNAKVWGAAIEEARTPKDKTAGHER